MGQHHRLELINGARIYTQWGQKVFTDRPLATIDACEYIFLENIHILTARPLASVSDKLHYGHPDLHEASLRSGSLRSQI